MFMDNQYRFVYFAMQFIGLASYNVLPSSSPGTRRKVYKDKDKSIRTGQEAVQRDLAFLAMK